jgi:hypothetical protein
MSRHISISTNNLETFFLWLQDQKFTGPVTLHCLDGVVREAQFGPPHRVVFAPQTPTRGALREKMLDKASSPAADSETESSP